VETTSVGMRKSKSRTNTDVTKFEHRKINQRGELVRVCSRFVFMKRDQVAFAA
jgi:acyl dehydratase